MSGFVVTDAGAGAAYGVFHSQDEVRYWYRQRFIGVELPDWEDAESVNDWMADLDLSIWEFRPRNPA